MQRIIRILFISIKNVPKILKRQNVKQTWQKLNKAIVDPVLPIVGQCYICHHSVKSMVLPGPYWVAYFYYYMNKTGFNFSLL